MRQTCKIVETEGVAAFLDGQRLAVVGASDDPKSFSTTIIAALDERGYDVVPVNPVRGVVNGRRCFDSVTEVPGVIDGVLIMVPAPRAADVVRDCITRGVRRVWLFRGVGPGSVSEEAVRLCHDADIDVVAGACPLMFLEPAALIHRVHRRLRCGRAPMQLESAEA